MITFWVLLISLLWSGLILKKWYAGVPLSKFDKVVGIVVIIGVLLQAIPYIASLPQLGVPAGLGWIPVVVILLSLITLGINRVPPLKGVRQRLLNTIHKYRPFVEDHGSVVVVSPPQKVLDERLAAQCQEALDALDGELLPDARSSYIEQLDYQVRMHLRYAPWDKEMRQTILRILGFIERVLPDSDPALKMKLCLWLESIIDKANVLSISKKGKKDYHMFAETKRFTPTVEGYFREFRNNFSYFSQLLGLLMKLKEYSESFIFEIVKEILSWQDVNQFDGAVSAVQLDFFSRRNPEAYRRIKAYLISASKGKSPTEVRNALRWLDRLRGMGL